MIRRLATTSLLVLAATACGAHGGDASRWPDVMVDDLITGRPVSSSTLTGVVAGGVSVISVWAVWCEPCRKELPMLAQLGRDRAGEVTVGGVNHGDDPEQAQAFLAELGVALPSLRDPDGRLVSALGVVSLPATFVVDDAGRIVWRRLGVVERDQVDAAVDAVVQPLASVPMEG